MIAKHDYLSTSNSLRDLFAGRNVATYPDGAVVADLEVIDEILGEDLCNPIRDELMDVKSHMTASNLTLIVLHP